MMFLGIFAGILCIVGFRKEVSFFGAWCIVETMWLQEKRKLTMKKRGQLIDYCFKLEKGEWKMFALPC
jgi:hypothetical protein